LASGSNLDAALQERIGGKLVEFCPDGLCFLEEIIEVEFVQFGEIDAGEVVLFGVDGVVLEGDGLIDVVVELLGVGEGEGLLVEADVVLGGHDDSGLDLECDGGHGETQKGGGVVEFIGALSEEQQLFIRSAHPFVAEFVKGEVIPLLVLYSACSIQQSGIICPDHFQPSEI
jgi:hypothetical protein